MRQKCVIHVKEASQECEENANWRKKPHYPGSYYPCPPSIIANCPQKMIVEKGKENCFDAVKNSDAEQRYKTPCFAVSAKGTKTHLSSISLSDSFPHDMAKSPVTSGFFVFWRSEKRMDPHAKKAAGNRKRTRKRDRKTQTDRYRKRTIRHGMWRRKSDQNPRSR